MIVKALNGAEKFAVYRPRSVDCEIQKLQVLKIILKINFCEYRTPVLNANQTRLILIEVFLGIVANKKLNNLNLLFV